jgi:3-deoxy-D-manno-octulosonate 8-phosphate phosphatase (KDO 8-P phosphatase)
MIKIKFNNKLISLSIIIYDFDGVMTNNKVILNDCGVESVILNRGDGYAISQIKSLKINQLIASTETNNVVKYRAEKLKIPVIYGVKDKKKTITKYCIKNGYKLSNVMFIGNDLNDYEIMQNVGVKGCPSDGEEEIKNISDWISDAKGGDGVIRELYRHILNNTFHSKGDNDVRY